MADRPLRARDRDLWDPGAQPERTYQAWTRTALALAACALFATRLAADAGWAALVVAATGVVAALFVVRAQKRRLHRAVIRSSPGAVATMTVLTAVLAVAGALLVAAGTAR